MMGAKATRSVPGATVAIAIASRNRPASLHRAVRSALRAVTPATLVIVVDQSDGPDEELQAMYPDVLYWHDDGVGVSRGRNTALCLAQTELVVFTDDDCEIDQQAVESYVEALADPSVAIAFGALYAPEAVNADGFIATYEPPAHAVLRGRRAKLRDGGVGGAMAVRRSVMHELGGFDERLVACEDGELAYRALAAGYGIAHVPTARVLHHGRRPWSVGRAYSYRTSRDIATAYATHLRAADPVATLLLAQHLRRLVWDVAQSLRHGRVRGLAGLRGFVVGVGRGMSRRRWTGTMSSLSCDQAAFPCDQGAVRQVKGAE